MNRKQRRTLGAVADLTTVLDSLYRIEHEKTKSKERIALQDIRESANTKRQILRDKAQTKLTQDRDEAQHRRSLLTKYDPQDISIDTTTGEWLPNDGAVSRTIKEKKQDLMYGLTGLKLDYDSPDMSMYQEILQSSNNANEPSWEDDPTPDAFTQRDIPQLNQKIYDEYEKKYGKETFFNESAIKNVIGTSTKARIGKDIMTTAEYNTMHKGLAQEDVYRDQITTNANTRMGDAIKQELADKDYIKETYQESPFSRAYVKTELGTTQERENWASSKEQLFKDLENDGVSEAGMVQYQNAINQIFNFNNDPREFLSAFKRWDRPSRDGGMSITEDIYNRLGLTKTSYIGTKDLIEGRNEKVKGKRLKPFVQDIGQPRKVDFFTEQFGNESKFIDIALDSGAIDIIKIRKNQYSIKVKNKNDFQRVMKTWIKNAEKYPKFREALQRFKMFTEQGNIGFE